MKVYHLHVGLKFWLLSTLVFCAIVIENYMCFGFNSKHIFQSLIQLTYNKYQVDVDIYKFKQLLINDDWLDGYFWVGLLHPIYCPLKSSWQSWTDEYDWQVY